MNQKIIIEKFKVFTIILPSLAFIIVTEGLLMMNDCTGVLKNITKAPTDLVLYFPIILLLYLFFKEIPILANHNSPLKFYLEKTGIAFFQDFHVWLAIFETFSMEKIQASELKQLRHLKTFSLELDRKKKCVRVTLFSKSFEEIEQRIRTSKPILETVLPEIHLISRDDVTKLYSKKELLKIGKEYILKEKTELIYPQFTIFPKESSSSISRMILAFDTLDEMKNEENLELIDSVQSYYLYSFDHKSFFKYLNKRFFGSPKESIVHFQDIQEFQKIRLSYQTDKKPFQSFQEGLDQFTRALSSISINPRIIETKEKQKNYRLIENLPLNLSNREKTSSVEMNQICSELCNFPQENKLTYKEKEKKCRKRTKFCQNLLDNVNFFPILESLINQKNKNDQIHLISELRRHLTYQQFICCLAHLSQQNYLKIPHRKLVDLIHALFQLNNKPHEVSNNDKKSLSPPLSDRSTEQITPSLTPN